MNPFKSFLSFLAFTVIIQSCTSSNEAKTTGSTTDAKTFDVSLYELRNIPGTNWKHVHRNHPGGDIYEQGFISNGQKTGTWTTFYPDDRLIQNIRNYSEGVMMGPYLEFDTHGRLNKQINYENDKMSGLYGEYQSGRVTKEMDYINGKINGFMREYNNKSVLIKEAQFKDDVLHGEVNNYNAEGKLVLQYIYKNGEVVSGGIVE